MLHHSPLRNMHPRIKLHIIKKIKRVIFKSYFNMLKLLSFVNIWFALIWMMHSIQAYLKLHNWGWEISFSIAHTLMRITTHATQKSCLRYTKKQHEMQTLNCFNSRHAIIRHTIMDLQHQIDQCTKTFSFTKNRLRKSTPNIKN